MEPSFLSKCNFCYPDNFETIFSKDKYHLVFDNFGLDYSHILFIPNQHILCFKGNYEKHYQVIKTVRNFYESNFENYLIYEHGNIKENRTDIPSIDHAHIHFIRCATSGASLFTDMIPVDFEEFYMNPATSHYHLLSSREATYYSYSDLGSQFFRRYYAKEMGLDFWDWKRDSEYIHYQLVQQKERKQSFCSRIYDYLERELIND